MKKAPLLITIGIIALSLLAYFGYTKFLSTSKTSCWDLIPASAVAVYEVSSCEKCIEPVTNSSLWSIIHKATFYTKGNDSLRSLINLISQAKANSLASLHVTKKDDFDFVFYIPLQNENEKKLYEATLESWKKKGKVKYTERVFNNTKIQELSTEGSVFSWVMLKDVFVASFTSFLIEDAIRVYDGQASTSFQQEIAQVASMNKIKQDAGNLYIHVKNFSDWLSVFVPDAELGVIEHFGKASILDIRAEENNIVLNGFSVEDKKGTSILSVFNNQSPTAFSVKHYVSNRTVMFTSYGISSGSGFGEKIRTYPGRPKAIQDTLAQIAKSMKVDLNNLYNTIEDEIGICYVESGGQKLSKVLLIETNAPDAWIKDFNTIAAQLSQDTIFFERFSDYEIRELPIYRFPEKLFSPFVRGFDHAYYTQLGSTIIIGEDVTQLKNFLEDIDREDTWGKSVIQNKFLESTLLESNVSLYINTPRIWNILSGLVNDKWKKFINSNQTELRSVGMGAIQFSHLNNSYYTNISWLNKPLTMVETSEPYEEQTTIVSTLNSPIIGNHFVVSNHVDKSYETFLQDSIERVHLISSKGDELWSLQMNGPIIGDVFQLDYFKNGKLQYFFATPGRIHVIDRLGNYVSPFPLDVKVKDIQFVQLIDYDHSKNYRLLLSDKSGKIWMYDKNGTNLEGWNPRDIEDDLMTKCSHYRIRGKDIIVAIRTDGRVYLMNRRGELMKGFPLNLDARPTGEYFLELGNSMQDTYFVVVSRDGYRIKFDLEGKVHQRETLIKQSIDTRFKLVKENTGKTYIIVRQNPTGLTILNNEDKEVFTNDYLGLSQVDVSYYDFGAGKIYYVLTDITQDLTYIYDSTGKLLTSPPLESHRVVLRLTKEDQLMAYITFDKSLYVKPL